MSQPTDRDLLEKLFSFFVGRKYVRGDVASIRDMTKRYAQPPFTLHYPVCAQMTLAEYIALGNLLIKIDRHLHPRAKEDDTEPIGDSPFVAVGDVSPHGDAQ